MGKVAQNIVSKKVEEGTVAIFWLGQAGFVFKTAQGKIIYVDPYLTDSVEGVAGFKRLTPSVIEPGEVRADWVVITHLHPDHLDIDAVPEIAKRGKTRFIGPPECMGRCHELGVTRDRSVGVVQGDERDLDGVRLLAVYADHGDLAPEAVGVMLDFDFTSVYITGDTSYSPQKMDKVFSMKPEVIIPVINGRFGNLNPQEAALLTRDVHAKVAIPCHFWTFAEHNGDPLSFVEACRKEAPQVKAVLIKQGGCYIYGK